MSDCLQTETLKLVGGDQEKAEKMLDLYLRDFISLFIRYDNLEKPIVKDSDND